MAADRWTQAVRQQVGLGRLLPLGEAGDGAWILESAAVAVLRRTTAVPGVRLEALRIALADPQDVDDPVVPLPPSALPPGPLRVTAGLTVTLVEPLPLTASLVREALTAAAAQRLGLVVGQVDVEVTDLLEDVLEAPEPDALAGPSGSGEPEEGAPEPGDSAEARVASAALLVPGVTGLTGALGGLGRPVHIGEVAQGTALPHRHVRVEVAVSGGHRALDVAREVRRAVRDSLEDRPTVAVTVTKVV